jgi:hypothetical protein
MENSIKDNSEKIKSLMKELETAESELRQVIADLKVERKENRSLAPLYIKEQDCKICIKELKYELAKCDPCKNDDDGDIYKNTQVILGTSIVRRKDSKALQII